MSYLRLSYYLLLACIVVWTVCILIVVLGWYSELVHAVALFTGLGMVILAVNVLIAQLMVAVCRRARGKAS